MEVADTTILLHGNDDLFCTSDGLSCYFGFFLRHRMIEQFPNHSIRYDADYNGSVIMETPAVSFASVHGLASSLHR